MNIRSVFAAVLALLSSSAAAQTPPPWNPGALPTAQVWNQYYGSKQDLLGADNPLNIGIYSIATPDIAQFWSGVTTLTAVDINTTAASPTDPEASTLIRMTIDTGAACGNNPLCFKIARGVETTMNPGSDNGYAHNDVLTINAGVGNFSGIATETDINDFNQDYPLFNQSGFTGVLSIAHNYATADNTYPISAFNYFGTLAIAPHFASHAGLYFIGATLLKDYTMFDWTSSASLIFDMGTHITGINLSGGTYSGNAFQSPGTAISGIGQSNFLTVQTPNYFFIAGGGSVGAPVPTSGQTVEYGDATYGDVHKGNGSSYDEVLFGTTGPAFAIEHGSINSHAFGQMSIAGLSGAGSRPVCVMAAGGLEAGTLSGGSVTCP